MRTIIISIFFVCFTQLAFSQSYTKADLYSFADSQDKKQILDRLKVDGYKYRGGSGVLVMYAKTPDGKIVDESEIEVFGFGKQEGLFLVTYKPKENLYSSFKTELLQDNYIFIEKKKKEEFYKNDNYIIGFQDKNGMILIMKKLNTDKH